MKKSNNMQMLYILVLASLILIASAMPARAFFLPDTGQTKCYSAKGNIKIITCPLPGDTLAQDGSYTINPPSYTANGDDTVSDNNTRLIWQQQDDNITRTWDGAVSYCENLNLGGYTDWRLPTSREIESIVDYEHSNPSIDSSVFLGTDVSAYWTSTTDMSYPENAWLVHFGNGATTQRDKVSGNFYVRCVRGNQLIFGDFIDNGNETITDRATGLTWQQGEAGLMNWGSALSYCENLSLGEYSDWRIPNVKELVSIIDDSIYNPAINTLVFPDAHLYSYWSSTTHLVDPNYAWFVFFSTGFVSNMMGGDFTGVKSDKAYVRCVRGEKTPLDNGEISVNPETIGFGIVGTGNSVSRILTLSNIGYADVGVGSITGPSVPFSITSDSCTGQTLFAGESCTVTIVFAPTTEGMFTDELTITSSDAENPIVTVSMVGNTAFLLPDTGYIKCYDYNGKLIDCPPPGDPLAQDGSYTINPPSYAVNGDGTVTDNNTGLMWQQEDDGQSYNWYKASGTYHKRYNRTISDFCGNLTLGGYTDWRLPTLKDLESIVHYGKSYPAIDSSVFSNTKSCYWSTDNYADPTSAWGVAFYNGKIQVTYKEGNCYIRCVRGEFNLNDFTNNGNGTITDSATGLMWQQNAVSVDENAGSAYCEGLTFAGYSDWRVPNIRELISLTDVTRINPPIYTDFFPQLFPSYDKIFFWSSTDGWYVDFINGWTDNYIDFNTRLACSLGGGMGTYKCGYFTRCVRGITATPQPATLTGTVTDSSTGQPLADVKVTVTDLTQTQSTTTDSNGTCTVTGLTQGNFTAVFKKSGYIEQVVNDTVVAGQTKTLDIQLSPVPPLNVSITSPVDGAILNSSPIDVTGSVSNNADITVNGIQSTVSNNTFSASIHLNEGQNTITAIATDQDGHIATHSITVSMITKGSIAGAVTDASTGLPLPSASASVIDSLNITQTVLTNPEGTYTINGIASGAFYGTIKKDGYATYDFSGTMATGQTIIVNAALNSMLPTAKTLGDYGSVTVIEVTGNYDAKNPDGSINELPRQEIAKEFFRTHQDDYDFFVIFSNFDFPMPDAAAKAFYLELKNDTQGIGKPILDNSTLFGSNSKLQGIIDMGNISNLSSSPLDPKFEETISLISHEQMHRWGANVKFKDANGNISTAFIGKDGNHWSFLLDSDASVLYGNDWQDNKNGTFTSTGAEKYYSPLDLYLMGFYDKSQVPPMLLIDNPAIDPTRLPEVGAAISGTPRYITIDDIIAAEGERIPSSSTSQKAFKTAFILITAPGAFTGNEIPGIENIRNAWAGRFSAFTGGKGIITEVAPSITIAIASPSGGETISGTDVTVRGAVINNAGNETGVTVNGIVAIVYGNQFIVNNVPLSEGSNTITVIATDTEGNTATTPITVSAITTGNYIQLTSNIESGIAPLEVTLRIDGSFSITDSNINVTGPVQPEVIYLSADEYEVKMTVEGTYYFIATVTGPDGIVYQDTITMAVLNKTQLDSLLKGKWEGMKRKLAEGNIDAAVASFAANSQGIYKDQFTALQPILQDIVNELNTDQIVMVGAEDGRGEYEILVEREGTIFSLHLKFIKDSNGLWKIWSF